MLAMSPLPMTTTRVRVDERNSGDDDDDDDIYGPPVERRIIRLLPSLAEELREETPVQRDAMHPRNQVSFMISSSSTFSSWSGRPALSQWYLLSTQGRDRRSMQGNLTDM